ncbi:MAG: hypothetical protein V4616_01645 [Bacteroidota bacterium]
MKALLIIAATALSLVVSAQRHGPSKNKYDINYSAAELKNRLAEPRVVFYEGLVEGEPVDFAVTVNSERRTVTVSMFARPGTMVPELNSYKGYNVRYASDRANAVSGNIQKLGSTQYQFDITSLPRGNYILTLDGVQTGQPITFSNY